MDQFINFLIEISQFNLLLIDFFSLLPLLNKFRIYFSSLNLILRTLQHLNISIFYHIRLQSKILQNRNTMSIVFNRNFSSLYEICSTIFYSNCICIESLIKGLIIQNFPIFIPYSNPHFLFKVTSRLKFILSQLIKGNSIIKLNPFYLG